ncbi:MAG: archease, partial [Chloroflexi bacterium]|nr:archease [Chloroflexota bacterium]
GDDWVTRHSRQSLRLLGTVGEPINPERHELRLGVKAVTRHMLDVSREKDGYSATVLFDI